MEEEIKRPPKICLSIDDGKEEDFKTLSLLNELGNLLKTKFALTIYLTAGHFDGPEKLKQYYSSYYDSCFTRDVEWRSVREKILKHYFEFSNVVVEIGCHSWQHFDLLSVHSLQVMANETEGAAKQLEQWIMDATGDKYKIQTYAPPYGKIPEHAVNTLCQMEIFKSIRLYQVQYEWQYKYSCMTYYPKFLTYMKRTCENFNFKDDVHFAGHSEDLFIYKYDVLKEMFAKFIEANYEFVTATDYHRKEVPF